MYGVKGVGFRVEGVGFRVCDLVFRLQRVGLSMSE